MKRGIQLSLIICFANTALIVAQTAQSQELGIVKTIFTRGPVPPIPANPLKYDFPSSKTLKIDGLLLGKCLIAGTILSGEPYYFSKDEMISPFNSSKFEDYIRATTAFGWAHEESTDLYKTGKEENLKAWINAQPDNSVDPVQLYEISLRLNSGNVWNAILTIHDLLRNNARFYHTTRYNYPESTRDVDHLFNKLIDIRGDLKERGAGFKGDHAGSWYRIWALLLIAQSRERNHPIYQLSSFNINSCEANEDPLVKIQELIVSTKMRLVAREAKKMEMGKAKGIYEVDSAGKIKTDTSASEAATALAIGLWIKPMTILEAKRLSSPCKNRSYLKPE